MKYRLKGFTLVELTVSVVILGILSSIAYVSYHRERRKTELKGAIAQVQVIAAAEKNYFMTIGAFVSSGSTAQTNTRLNIRIQDAYFRNYQVASNATAFNVTVNGGNATYTFNDNGDLSSCAGSDCV